METLRSWRERHNVTQEELARRTGIPAALISKYERGSHRPALRNALAIARATTVDGVVGVPVETWEQQTAAPAPAASEPDAAA